MLSDMALVERVEHLYDQVFGEEEEGGGGGSTSSLEGNNGAEETGSVLSSGGSGGGSSGGASGDAASGDGSGGDGSGDGSGGDGSAVVGKRLRLRHGRRRSRWGVIEDRFGASCSAGFASYMAESSAVQGAGSKRAAHRHLLQQSGILASLEERGLLPLSTPIPTSERTGKGEKEEEEGGRQQGVVDDAAAAAAAAATTAAAAGKELGGAVEEEEKGDVFSYAELGAGRGMLGLAVRAAAGPRAPLVLVEV
jgi:hypothetical protein